MIKKSLFEDEIISNMEQQLSSSINSEAQLDKAISFIKTAVEIFDDLGMKKQVNTLLKTLFKAAVTSKSKPVTSLPAINKLKELGITDRDLKTFNSGDPIAKAKMNLVLRQLNLDESQIAGILGASNIMPLEEIENWLNPESMANKIWQWTTIYQDPKNYVPPQPEEINKDLVFKSLAEIKCIHKKVNDPHTTNLSVEKMVKNLLHHGTQFNMANDGNDIMNADIDEDLEVTDNNEEFSSFEDE